MSNNYPYDESGAANGQHISVPTSNNHGGTLLCSETNDLPGPKFYRTSSQAIGSAVGLDTVEGTNPQVAGSLTTALGDITNDVTAVSALSIGVPEPASPDVVIWSDSYEKAAETRLSDALKQRIRNIFLTPSERELKTLQMADSFALSRGQQRCRVTSFELGRKVFVNIIYVMSIAIIVVSIFCKNFQGLIATECIYPNQAVIEYKGYAMLVDEYGQQYDYRRQ